MPALTPPNSTGGKLKIQGHTGLNAWHGYVEEEWLAELKGRRAIPIYREMSDNEPTIYTSLMIISNLMRGVKWSVDQCEGSTEEDAKFLESCMEDMEHTWDDFIDEALSMFVYGWAYHEVCYKIRRGASDNPVYDSAYTDGKISWRKIPIRGQETLDRWEMDYENNVLGMWQRHDQFGPPAYIPLERAVHFRTTKHKNNPEGRSMLRGAYRPWFFKRNIEIIEGIGIERDLAGYPVMHVPPELLMDSAPADLKNLLSKLTTMLRQVKRDEREGIIVPNEGAGYKFELLSASGARQFNTGEVIERKTKEILITFLTDFIVLGHQKVGTYALSDNKTRMFAAAVNSWVETITDVINEQLVWRLFKINGMDQKNHPKIKAGAISFRDVIEKLEGLSKMGMAGLIPSPAPMSLTNELLRDLDLPELPEDVLVESEEKAKRSAEMEEQAAQANIEATLAAAKQKAQPPTGAK